MFKKQSRMRGHTQVADKLAELIEKAKGGMIQEDVKGEEESGFWKREDSPCGSGPRLAW